MKKPKRIRYSLNGIYLVSSLYYSFIDAYFGIITQHGSEVKWEIKKSINGTVINFGYTQTLHQAKQHIRKNLIDLGCLLGKEIKKGITIDKDRNLVVK
jgi:hypothetical protein